MRTHREPRLKLAPAPAGGDELDWRGCKLEDHGLLVPDDLAPADWAAVGQTLCRMQSQFDWATGDWWAFGAARYGERKSILDSKDWTGPAYQTCRNAAVVSRAFAMSQRRDNLSFSHHAEVAALPPDEADRLLAWAEAPLARGGKRRTVDELKEERRRAEVEAEERQAAEAKAVAERWMRQHGAEIIQVSRETVRSVPWTQEMAAAEQAARAAATSSAPAAAADDTRRAAEPAPPPVQRPTTVEAPRDDEDDEAARRMVAAAKDALTLRLSERMRERLMRVVAELLDAPGSASFH
jgi:hypothetical protein